MRKREFVMEFLLVCRETAFVWNLAGAGSFSYIYLLLLRRIIGFDPFLPSPLKGVYLGESHRDQLQCHPGTGSFVGSGAVQDQRFLPRIHVGPFFRRCRVFPDGTRNLAIAPLPVFRYPDVDDDQIGCTEPRLELLL